MGLFDSIGSVIGAPISIVGDVLGGITGSSKASENAINAQTNSANQANATQQYMYDQTRADQQPWRQAGTQALQGLQNPDFQKTFSMSDFTADPGYQFRMDEGQKALERSAASKGGLMSGGTLKALTRYGQGVASDEYQNAYNRFNNDQSTRFNRLSSIAGVGQTANNTVASAGQNYANTVSGNQVGLGNANAAATMGAANMNTQLLGQGAQLGTMAYLMCDERTKTEIREIAKDDLDEMRAHLRAYKFQYKDIANGGGDFVGVMAQDLEKSKLGRTLVKENAQGLKQIDIPRLLMLFLATLAEA